MRFTFINPKRKAPSFKAKYDTYVFTSLAIAQILSIAFAILALWNFLPEVEAVYLGTATVIFLAIAFFISYRSVQSSHLVSLFSILGIELLSLQNIPRWFTVSIFSMSAVVTVDDYLVLLALFDIVALIAIFYANTVFPSHLHSK